jgi:hypothetical protein
LHCSYGIGNTVVGKLHSTRNLSSGQPTIDRACEAAPEITSSPSCGAAMLSQVRLHSVNRERLPHEKPRGREVPVEADPDRFVSAHVACRTQS